MSVMDEKRQYLYDALQACKKAQKHFDKAKRYRLESKVDGSSIFHRTDKALLKESEKEREVAEKMIAGYEEVREAIPYSWRTVPMYHRMIEFVEEGYSDDIIDIVMNYRYYFRDLQEKKGIND